MNAPELSAETIIYPNVFYSRKRWIIEFLSKYEKWKENLVHSKEGVLCM